MNGLLIRRTTGIGVILLMASLVVMVGLPVAAIEGNCTLQDGGWNEGATSGVWGTITNNGNGSVTVAVNAGYSLELCVKGGSGYEVYNVTDSGGTFWPPANCGSTNQQCGLSHWGIRSVGLTTTTTGSTTTTTEHGSTTTTTGGSTTTTTGGSTTTTTGGSTTTTEGVTSTTGGTPTTAALTTTSQGVTTTAAETAVQGIQVSAPVTPQVAAVTQETLPFTGVSSGSLAMLASVISGVGLLLLLASRQNEERVTARSWR